MRSRIWLIVWFILVVVVIPTAAVMLALDTTATVPENQRISFDDVRRAKDLFARYDPRRMKPEEMTAINATAGELNTVIGATLSGLKHVRSHVIVDRAEVVIDVTLELPLPLNPLGRFVNLRAGIATSDHGLDISQFAVGALVFPPQILKPLLRFAFEVLADSDKGDEILASIKSVSVVGDQVTIAYQPSRGLAEDVETAARRAIAAADPIKVKVFYDLLHQRVIQAGGTRQSLAPYVSAVFRMAEQRSVDGDPVEENRAAIFALAMYFGDDRFERIAGAVRTGTLQSVVPRVDHIGLEGRRDWVQHFVISAGLTVAAGVGIADFIGVAKEVKDSDGPSGFSFTDIGADRAGVRLAERAIASPASARAVQQALVGPIEEAEFFPRVDDLPEGLSEAEFRRLYGDIDSAEFSRLIADIDRRIVAIPLYR